MNIYEFNWGDSRDWVFAPNKKEAIEFYEFENLEQSNKNANEFIKDIAELLNMDTDSVGYDDIQFDVWLCHVTKFVFGYLPKKMYCI